MSDPIYTSPDMIKAGMDRLIELQEFQPDRAYVVREIYRVMEAAKVEAEKITPAMIAAGVRVLVSQYDAIGGLVDEIAVADIFKAMIAETRT